MDRFHCIGMLLLAIMHVHSNFGREDRGKREVEKREAKEEDEKERRGKKRKEKREVSERGRHREMRWNRQGVLWKGTITKRARPNKKDA